MRQYVAYGKLITSANRSYISLHLGYIIHYKVASNQKKDSISFFLTILNIDMTKHGFTESFFVAWNCWFSKKYVYIKKINIWMVIEMGLHTEKPIIVVLIIFQPNIKTGCKSFTETIK